MTRRHMAPRAVLAAVVGAALMVGCVGGSGSVTTVAPTTVVVDGVEEFAYQLVCPSPIGDLATTLQFAVTADPAEVERGARVAYRISAPLAQVDAPITPTFASSTTTYAVPAGLTVTSARMDPTTTKDFTSTSTAISDTEVSYTLVGDFRLDGSDRSTPDLVVEATVDADAGSTIVWETPLSIVGDASAPIIGTRTSSCSFPTAGTISTTTVV